MKRAITHRRAELWPVWRRCMAHWLETMHSLQRCMKKPLPQRAMGKTSIHYSISAEKELIVFSSSLTVLNHLADTKGMHKMRKPSSDVLVSSLYQRCFSGVNGEQIWVFHWILPVSLWDFLLLWHINVVWTGQIVWEYAAKLYGVLIWPLKSQKVALMRSSERRTC